MKTHRDREKMGLGSCAFLFIVAVVFHFHHTLALRASDSFWLAARQNKDAVGPITGP
jgi:hypothetical protein